MKSITLLSLATGLAALMASPLHAQFIDDFTTGTVADSANYTTVVGYNGDSYGPGVFNINGSDEFQPEIQNSQVDEFIRNSQDFAVGATLTVDLDSIALGAGAGLTFGENALYADSIGGTTGNDELTVNGSATNVSGQLEVSTDDPLVITVTRTDADDYSYSFSGGGLSPSDSGLTGTVTDSTPGPISVGIFAFSGNNAYEGLTYGSFSLTAGSVPEPATWALMLGGLGLLVFVGRLRSKRS